MPSEADDRPRVAPRAAPTPGTWESVVNLFERAASENPDRVAVEDGDRTLSYAQLRRESYRMAGELRSAGAERGTLVAVCLDRTVDFAVAVLGIVRTGAAWLPLDPAYPDARLTRILETGRPTVIVTSGAVEDRLPQNAMRRVRTEAPPTSASLAPQTAPAVSIGRADTAYVMFTSGSTGEPKGVVLTHGGLSNYVREMGSALGIVPSDIYLHSAPFGFSSSVRQLLVPLTHGARVVLASASELKDPARLFLEAVSRGVTVVDFVPSYWRAMMDGLAALEPDRRALVSSHPLRLSLSASEPLTADVVRRWRTEFGRSEPFLNMYGQTETTGIVAVYQIPPVLDGTVEVLPIGLPIGGLRIEILGEDRRPVPAGSVGEIWVGGAGVGRGYLHREAETSEAFQPDPFAAEPGALTYRTGDLGIERADGMFEHRGRLDDQVKVRGVRVELEEVNRALARLTGVRECAVLARESQAGVNQILAYVALYPGVVLDVPALRSQLAMQLPDAMIPSAFRFVEELPKTPGGKTDRQDLSSRDAVEPARDEPDGPRTATEKALTDIWKEVLRVDRIGLHDDFFELGGDSISSFRMIARSHQGGIRITPGQLMTHSTIAGLASVAGATSPTRADWPRGEGPLAPTPMASLFWEHRNIAPDHYNQAVLLDVPSDVSAESLRLAFRALVMHHDALRMRWDKTEKGFRTFVSPRETEAQASHFERMPVSSAGRSRQAASLLQTLNQSRSGEGTIEFASSLVQGSIELSRGPIARAVLFEDDGVATRLLLCVHHLAVDGVSWRILLEDLQNAYAQAGRGEAIELPPRTTSFKQWSELLAARAASTETRDHLPFWSRLRGAMTPALPRDGPAPHANTVASRRTISVALTAEETTSFLRETGKTGRSEINAWMLTALVRALQPWTGASSLLVEIEGHGRQGIGKDVDLSRTVGWFTTDWPLLLDISGASGFEEALRRVRRQDEEARNRQITFGLLKYLGDPESRRLLEGVPQPEVRLNYLGQFDGVLNPESGFRLTRESAGPASGPEGNRRNVLDLFGSVLDGRLQFDWAYSENLNARETVERIAQRYVSELRQLIASPTPTIPRAVVASDVPLARFGQAAIDRVTRRGGEGSLEDVYPATSMQAGMLFHGDYDPTSGSYLVRIGYRIQGALDEDEFERAWNRVVGHHPILRTTFVPDGVDGPVQAVWRTASVRLERHDLTRGSEAVRRAAIARHLESEQGPFALDEAPLMRLALFRESESSRFLLWSLHHALLDGWSKSVILGDVFREYEAALEDRADARPASIPFREYVAWLEANAANSAESESFWRDFLLGFQAPTPFAGAIAPAAISLHPAGTRGAERTRRIAGELSEAARKLARETRSTVNVVLQAVWATLVSRYSGEEDVVFGATISTRPPFLNGSESMVGLLINTVPVRTRVGLDDSGRDLIERLRHQQAARFPFETASLSDIQGWSEVPRGVPLFESVFVFHNFPEDSFRSGDGALSIRRELSVQRTHYAITLVVTDDPSLSLTIGFDPARFDPRAIERMLEHAEILLGGLLADPDDPLTGLPILTAEELHLLGESQSP